MQRFSIQTADRMQMPPSKHDLANVVAAYIAIFVPLLPLCPLLSLLLLLPLLLMLILLRPLPLLGTAAEHYLAVIVQRRCLLAPSFGTALPLPCQAGYSIALLGIPPEPSLGSALPPLIQACVVAQPLSVAAPLRRAFFQRLFQAVLGLARLCARSRQRRAVLPGPQRLSSRPEPHSRASSRYPRKVLCQAPCRPPRNPPAASTELPPNFVGPTCSLDTRPRVVPRSLTFALASDAPVAL